MLGQRNYTQDYIDACRSKVESDIAAYRQLVAAGCETEAFEATFFNNMVLVLDHLFVHRLRTVEGKDGNPLNEVRVMCDSMLQNGSTMSADRSIKLLPAKSVLKVQFGETIKLTEADFLRIYTAFFAEIERKYLVSRPTRMSNPACSASTSHLKQTPPGGASDEQQRIGP